MNDNILAYCSAMAQARRMLSLRLITKEEYGKIDTMMLHKYGLSLGASPYVESVTEKWTIK